MELRSWSTAGNSSVHQEQIEFQSSSEVSRRETIISSKGDEDIWNRLYTLCSSGSCGGSLTFRCRIWRSPSLISLFLKWLSVIWKRKRIYRKVEESQPTRTTGAYVEGATPRATKSQKSPRTPSCSLSHLSHLSHLFRSRHLHHSLSNK